MKSLHAARIDQLADSNEPAKTEMPLILSGLSNSLVRRVAMSLIMSLDGVSLSYTRCTLEEAQEFQTFLRLLTTLTGVLKWQAVRKIGEKIAHNRFSYSANLPDLSIIKCNLSIITTEILQIMHGNLR